MSRPAIATLSTENLLHNFQVIKDKVGSAKIIAMVKANAYGHGIRSISSRLNDHVDILGVASVDEALTLRKIGITVPILLAEGVFEPDELVIASRENFQVVFSNKVQLEWLEKCSTPIHLEAWIKINTGMGRLGSNFEEAKDAYSKLVNHRSVIKPIKIMSHFACADNLTHPLNQEQIQAFQAFIKNVQGEFSLCNSAGIFHFPECYYDYVRPGLALYGVSPIKGKSAAALNLKPVMTLKTRLISVQMMPKGAYIGYEARYRCPENMPIGVIAFGYGDGYPITARDGTPILINKIECPLAGRVSMDMMTVDLRPCPTAKIGDPVILWGDGLPIERVAEHTSNITWDMLTGVQHRVRFFWRK